MPICKKCGFKLEKNIKFCPECGTPVTEKSTRLKVTKQVDLNKTLKRTGQQSYGYTNLENLPEGYLIDNRYEIKEKLGQGGFGAVYRAFDKDMNIDKALKVIPEEIINDKEAMFDLQKEAQTMISLNHSNIVRVYDFHKSGKIKYIDMEYIDGKTLTEIKLEHPQKQIPETKVKELAIKIADGLAYAHSNNILHKDIKPQNVMVTTKGKVKIMDFGIADTILTSMRRIVNTSTSGTLPYMPPEQILGESVGKESDIYSFGITLYELLSGHPPFYLGDITYQILKKKPTEIESISSEMNVLLQKCLEKDYKNRYGNFEEIIKKLVGKLKSYKKGTIKKPSLVEREPQTHEEISKLMNISITTDPSGAVIWLNEKKLDKITPIRIMYKTGITTIKAEKEGYVTLNKEIEITESGSNDFFIELESVIGTITVETDKPGQKIWINNKETKFRTPHTFENIIPEKKYEIHIYDKEYYSTKQFIQIKELENKTIKPRLLKYSFLKIETSYKNIIFIINEKKYEDISTKKFTKGHYNIKPSLNYLAHESEIDTILDISEEEEIEEQNLSSNFVKEENKILNYLPEINIILEEEENKILNYDEMIPKRNIFIKTGKYKAKAFFTNEYLEKDIKLNENNKVLPGTGTLILKSKHLKKTIIIDKIMDDITIYSEKEILAKKKGLILRYMIFIISLIILYVLIRTGIMFTIVNFIWSIICTICKAIWSFIKALFLGIVIIAFVALVFSGWANSSNE